MSSPRVQKIFQGMTESLRKLGPYADAFKTGIKWQGRDALGRDSVLIDLTAAAWATANLRVIVAAEPATDANDTAALHTQSHASGHFLDGSVSFKVYMEAPATWTGAHSKFVMEILHVLRGQLGAPIELLMTANTVNPTVNGVNGAGATAAFTSAGTFQPYFFVVAGGI